MYGDIFNGLNGLLNSNELTIYTTDIVLDKS